MSEPRLGQVRCLDSRSWPRMAYWQAGDVANPKARVCVQGPRAPWHGFAAVGHAPTLVQPGQIEVLRSLLLAP
jgi:hypothetical protein